MIQQWLLASYPWAVAPSVTYATWNPSDKSANITLSNSDLTATGTSWATYNEVRATIGKSSEKWYWESTFSEVDWGWRIDWVWTLSASLSWYVGIDGNWWWTRFYNYGWWTWDKVHSNSFSAYGLNSPNVANSTVYGFALDMDSGTLEVFKDNVSQWVAWTGITWTVFPMTSIWTIGSSVTTNFWATTMAFTAPSWYNQGIYN